MDKKDYYKISVENNLPLRCPILNTCQRRAMTIYFFSYRDIKHIPWEEALLHEGELSTSYKKEKIELQGEAPEIMSGANLFYFNNVCPEVSLFDESNRPGCVDESPCVKGEWDNFRNDPKFINLEQKHYLECAEFNLWKHSLKKKPRKTITSALRAKLQQEISSVCPFCQNKDVGHFDVHHIDENPQNNNYDNLLMLCKICHSKITKGEISILLVKSTKAKLQ